MTTLGYKQRVTRWELRSQVVLSSKCRHVGTLEAQLEAFVDTISPWSKLLSGVQGKPPVVFLLILEEKKRFNTWMRTNGERGRKKKGTSRSVSTKRLPEWVCSILSISKAGLPVAHRPVIVSLSAPILHNPTRALWGSCSSLFFYISAIVWSSIGWGLVLLSGSRMGAKDNYKSGEWTLILFNFWIR